MPDRQATAGITVPPPAPTGLAGALQRNIRALQDRRLAEEAASGTAERIAEAITRFTGSMRFVCLHLLLFGLWVAANLGVIPLAPRFDPTFVILATWASVEAIFLSTFVLISQNRAAAAADKRADLDLQISLLAEHEVTRLVSLTAAIAEHLGIVQAHDPELVELSRDVAPEAVLDEIEATEKVARRAAN
jgi:uncharacterized membrane protein